MGVLNNMNPKTDVISENTSPKIKNQMSDGFVTGEAPDISKTEVDEDFIESLVEGTMGVKSEKKQKIKETKTKPTPKINESKIEDLISRLSSLLQEAKQILKETGTTTGMMGSGPAGRKIIIPKRTREKR